MGCSAGTHHGNSFWINLDPCGLICGMMTWVLIAFGMFATTTCVILPWLGPSLHGYTHTVLFNGVCVIAAYNHWRAMTTDPGSVPKDARPLPGDVEEMDLEASSAQTRNVKYKKYCKRCQAFKPVRAHHCSMCNRCIIKMDHHCPWINNCVGVGNHKLFLLFIFWINIISCYALILIIAKHVSCSVWRSSTGCHGSPRASILTIFLLVEAILFGMFTLCMFADQMPSITSNETQIDRLKNQKHEIQTDVNEIFGTPGHVTFSLSWLVPSPAHFPESCRHIIHGYCVDSNAFDTESELVPLNTAEASFDTTRHELSSAITNPLLADDEGNGRLPSPSSTSSLSSAGGTVRKRNSN